MPSITTRAVRGQSSGKDGTAGAEMAGVTHASTSALCIAGADKAGLRALGECGAERCDAARGDGEGDGNAAVVDDKTASEADGGDDAEDGDSASHGDHGAWFMGQCCCKGSESSRADAERGSWQ